MKLRRSIAFLVFAVFFLSAHVSLAFPRAILMIRDFHNWLDFSYEYDARESDGSGSKLSLKEHQFIESYHFDMQYAFYNPRWVHGNLALDLGMKEEWYDGTVDGSGNRVNTETSYRLDGIIMDRKKTPIDFFTQSLSADVDRRFARNYDLQTDNHGVALTLKNRTLPIHLRYLYNRSETDGLDLDRVQKTSTMAADAIHQYRDVSLTEVYYTHTDDDTTYHGSQPSESNTDKEFQARNTLSWGEYLKRSYLTSSYRTRDESGFNDLKSTDWSESLFWKPGFALSLRLNYQLTDDETSSQDRREQKMGALLEHRLYDSLITRLRVRDRHSDYDQGKEDELGWLAGFSYRKKLPRDSLFNLSYSYHYKETDRNLDGNLFFVINELLTIDLFSRNVLANPDVVADSIVVQNESRTFTYQLGVDYLVQQLGRETELIIPAGSLIANSDTVSLDYQYTVDPDLDYSTTVHQASTSLSLFERRYRLYANLVLSDQELLDSGGDPDMDDRLYDLHSYTVGCEVNRGAATCGLEYVDYDSTTDKRRHVESFWRYHRYYPRQFFFFSLKDRVTWHEDLGAGIDTGGTENIFTVAFKYKRKLPLAALAEASIDFLNHRGRNNDRDELNLKLSYKLQVGKLECEASIENNLEWYEQTTSREDEVWLKIRRYF